MDLDLLTDIWDDGQPVLSGNLPPHPPHRIQILDGQVDPQSAPFQGTINNSQAGAVVSKIENIFENIASCILDEEKVMSIKLKNRGKLSATGKNATTGNIRSIPNEVTRSIEFPSKSPKEAWKFTVLFRILELSHEALVTGVVLTKRDIFYRSPELFIKQSVVDRYVEGLAYTLGVERHALNVVAAVKGLIAGCFKAVRNDGSIADYSAEADGTLIPNARDVRRLEMQEIQWVLVIEKEATFRSLAITKYWETSPAGIGIILTAKGYPDIRTRQFLRLISVQALDIPIFALVDFDPDGIGIMSTYKYGSMALAHENLNLAVPSIRWLGVKSSDIVQGSIDHTGLLKLSSRDRGIARRMLQRDVFGEDGREQEWRRELQVMLMLNVKAEIQILSSGGGVESWLDGKLLQGRTLPIDTL